MAEDNQINLRVALGQLHKLGFKAEGVASGLEVLAALEQVEYDCILMDCQMPDMDGYQTSTEIRRRERLEPHKVRRIDPSIPLRIVALTANALNGDREKCFAAGMDDYLSKPVRMKELEAALCGKQLEQPLAFR